MHWFRARRALVVLPLVLLWVFGSALPAASVTKKQVDEACATSKAALDEWEEALARAADEWTSFTADYLIAHPMLSDYLTEGLDLHGLRCD